MRDLNKIQDLANNFNQNRIKIDLSKREESKSITKETKETKGRQLNISNETKPRRQKRTKYDEYKDKLKYDMFDKFTSEDYLYFFCDKMQERGTKFVVTNRPKYLKPFKMAMENYSNEELIVMIAFVFESNQDYLDVKGISPFIFNSTWCNTLYQDSQDWINDNYIPKSQKKHSKRECTIQTTENKATIGEWD